MRALLRVIGAVLALAVLTAGTGLHLAALQAVAWATMLLERVPESGLADAVEETFSGEKPCHLCKAVKRGTQEQQAPKQRPTSPGTELLAIAPSVADAPQPCSGVPREYSALPALATSRTTEPLHPPPRG